MSERDDEVAGVEFLNEIAETGRDPVTGSIVAIDYDAVLEIWEGTPAVSDGQIQLGRAVAREVNREMFGDD